MKAEYISHMGDDLTVVNAARVSFDKHVKRVADDWLCYTCEGHGCSDCDAISEKDTKLIKYLATHGHWTPFSHPQITMRYTVPIFIARQEFKHIVGFTRNEVSRRYVDDTPELFTPKTWRSRPDGSVKQGSGAVMNDGQQHSIDSELDYYYRHALHQYQNLLDRNVAPEQARMVLPQSMYTSYWITGSLAAFARMVSQRSDPHAQVEIQELAAMVDQVIRPLYPVSWSALVDTNDA